MAKTLIWLLVHSVLFTTISPQIMDLKNPNITGICKGALITRVDDLKILKGCVVILGSLEIFIEIANQHDYDNIAFKDLREITEYLVLYRVRELESVGQLFPNLARIRGLRLINNFALVVYDCGSLREIGLYNLLKIDRGGITMWALPQACFVDTIDWNVLAPNSRRVISSSGDDMLDKQVQCSVPCRCSANESTNRCWNNMKCQLFLEGPEAEKCDKQCIGCRKTNMHSCFVCRDFTYKGKCVTRCPSHTILLPDNQYCITEKECLDLDRLVWNNTCIAHCPKDYKLKNLTESNGPEILTCEPCTHCENTCGNLKIQSLNAIQSAERCVFVKGYLVIKIRAIPGVMSELRAYLSQIQEVSGYVSVEGSDITTLDFLTSLRLIKGEKLKDDKYSIDISRNYNLQTLFTPAVTKNLIIKNGTVKFQNNPVLCMSKIDEIKSLSPIPPDSFDIPEASNGEHGACKEISFDFQITVANESSAMIKFSPVVDHSIHYTALYVRLPPGVYSTIVPETCSEFEWHTIDVSTVFDHENYGVVELSALQPASSYALCIEIYDPEKKRLVRSNIFNFTTPVGIPEPPFIVELVASAPGAVVVSWVDHKDYVLHIDHYELDVALIEKDSKKSATVDYCQYKEDLYHVDYTPHALVRRPPPEYTKSCESMCGMLSSVTPGAMVEEYFDVCDDINIGCNNNENKISTNSSFGNYVRSMVLLDIKTKKNIFQVAGLAPFSDYKFRLRACSSGQCSRSTKGVVRTYGIKEADIPVITYVYANQFGHIFVKWNPPNVTNGPILSYSVEILPKIIYVMNLMPQIWCVPADETRIFVQSVIISKYLVRVCVRTLASSNSCSDWMRVAAVTESKTIMMWVGVICGILIYIASCIVGWLKRRLRDRSDVVPLVDSSSSSRVETEPPALMLSDFVPFHTISLD